MKIVVEHDMGLYPDQKERLDKLGEVTYFDKLPETEDEWVERVKDFDVICSGKFGLTKRYHELKDKLISVPFVGVGWFDPKIGKERNLVLSKSPGCNKHAVSEWITWMMLSLFRRLDRLTNTEDFALEPTIGLKGRNITILGKGNIGTRVKEISNALEMEIKVFKRGDNLIESIKDADVVVNCLSTNPSTIGMLDKGFFDSFKKDSFFITVTSPRIYDPDALIEAIDRGIIKMAATDCGGIQVGKVDDPFYTKFQKHPKILATPHISYNTDVTDRIGNDMMIDNIEAWIKGKPINVVR